MYSISSRLFFLFSIFTIRPIYAYPLFNSGLSVSSKDYIIIIIIIIIIGRGGRRGSSITPLERAMVVSYRLSIVTVALSVTIRPQFAIECLRRSFQQGVGQFGLKF